MSDEKINYPIEIIFKCENAQEANTYLKARMFANALHEFSYALGRAVRKGYHLTAQRELTEEESRIYDEILTYFQTQIAECDISWQDLDL